MGMIRRRGRRRAQTAAAREWAQIYRARAEAKLAQAHAEPRPPLPEPGRQWYRRGPLDGLPADGPCLWLEVLIEEHTAMYSDPVTRAWVAARLKAWGEQCGGAPEPDDG